MKLEITVVYYMEVEPDWYSPEVLSGEGSLESQICAYEKSRIDKDGMYLMNLKAGKASVECVNYGDKHCSELTKHTRHPWHDDELDWYMCNGETEDIRVSKQENEENSNIPEGSK